MNPSELRAESFADYGSDAQALAAGRLGVLRQMPLPLLPSYLVQLRDYDSLFPPEQGRLRIQLDALARQPGLMRPFASITLTTFLERMNWLSHPAAFVSALSPMLWQTGQINAYHRAAEDLFAALPSAPRSPGSRAPLLIVVFGRGSTNSGYRLFTRLGPSGMYLRRVGDAGAIDTLCAHLRARAQTTPQNYAHWYVDGGESAAVPPGDAPLDSITFPGIAPVTDAVLHAMDKAVQEGTGPELLADRLREMGPAALGLDRVTGDIRIRGLLLSLMTQGSGTQLYSTSFVQTAAVELLRRAQPETLLARFAPRRKPASMNDMLQQRSQSLELDPDGALVDADMATYYAWLALQRNPGGAQASLIAYVEGRGQAFVAGPSVTRGVESTTPVTMQQVLNLVAVE